MTLTFMIKGDPIPWKAPYVGIKGAFSPLTKVMKEIRLTLQEQNEKGLLEGALEMDLFFMIRIPKSASKKTKEKMLSGEIMPIFRPDRDNLQKFISDVLQTVAYENDCTIVSGRTEEFYSEIPGTFIFIRPFEMTEARKNFANVLRKALEGI